MSMRPAPYNSLPMKKAALVALLFVACAAGTLRLAKARTFQLFGEIVPRVETDRRVVALTFDDGPQSDTVDAILRDLNVKATFFVCGGAIEEHPQAAVELVKAGHELGNHSFSHQRMWFKSPAFVASEIERTDALIRAAGHRGAIHFRAPYCKKLVAVPWYLARHQRTHVTWDVEPETFPEIDRDADRIVAYVLERARPGSIILLHPWYRGRERTRAAVPKIIRGLREKGFEFVTVSELLAMRTTRA
jgi:peptidoglycan-N-acetylglucosamine deacetylase